MIFASDLDNTLIYSYKKAEPGDICVERREGKELSFMKSSSLRLLKDIAKRCTFIPITTRTLEQYRRIDFGFVPDYAIVCHGARLLRRGEIDENWELESRRLCSPERTLAAGLPALEEEENLLRDIRYADGFFIFAKSDHPAESVKRLKTRVNADGYNVCAVHNKVYVIPKGLDKGGAILRLKKLLSDERKQSGQSPLMGLVCAGDSLLDIPMLKCADIAVAPRGLNLKGDRSVELFELPDETFTEEVLNTVNKILKGHEHEHRQNFI